jgi:CRISPR-associated endonuclease/helicase Cas3
MYARHRSEVLAQVRVRLLNGEPCRLVATSLIEAGVDVDFPAVLRAEAGLDSIAQASGRCNREGKHAASESIVTVFSVDESEYAPPPELKQFAQVFREVHRAYPNDPLSLEAVRAYFEKLYWQKGDRELDKHNILGQLRESRAESLPFETIAAQFRLIESTLYPVIIAVEHAAQEAVEELKFAASAGGAARQLQPFIVGVPRQGYDALLKAGAIVPIAPERYEHQFMLLANPDLYSREFGLHWENPSFIKSESLFW